jgi:periplasmic divalent cation tolerance protein
MKDKAALLLTTCPSTEIAENLAEILLKGRLAGCTNILPGISSHYWWEGKIAKDSEVLLLIKTLEHCVEPLKKKLLEIHPYTTPACTVINVQDMPAEYLKWLNSVCLQP